jgi:hypothetical protein
MPEDYLNDELIDHGEADPLVPREAWYPIIENLFTRPPAQLSTVERK